MSTIELITRAKSFHQHAGFNPERYDYKVSLTPTGKSVKAYEKGAQTNYYVAFYNSKSGRTITPLRSF